MKTYTYDPRPETISYAQNYEDMYLRVLLPGIENGFYVDVGANDPSKDSVTKYFYDRGWHGINVEPSPGLIKKLKRDRKRDSNLQLALGDKPGELTFREYLGESHGLSTLSPDMKREHGTEGLPFKDYKVQVVKLEKVLAQHAAGQAIDFLKVDVEGFEEAVLNGNDWAKFRPKIVVVEANHAKSGWQKLLAANKYERVFFDGLNAYFASAEYVPNIDFKNFPPLMLEGEPIISWREYARRDTLLGHYEADLGHLKQRIKELDDIIARRDSEKLALEAKLKMIQRNPVRYFAGGASRKLKKKLKPKQP